MFYTSNELILLLYYTTLVLKLFLKGLRNEIKYELAISEKMKVTKINKNLIIFSIDKAKKIKCTFFGTEEVVNYVIASLKVANYHPRRLNVIQNYLRTF